MVLRLIFPGRFILQRDYIPWSTFLPDQSLCDYLLTGYLKAEIFKCRLQTTGRLKDFIHHEIAPILEASAAKILCEDTGVYSS